MILIQISLKKIKWAAINGLGCTVPGRLTMLWAGTLTKKKHYYCFNIRAPENMQRCTMPLIAELDGDRDGAHRRSSRRWSRRRKGREVDEEIEMAFPGATDARAELVCDAATLRHPHRRRRRIQQGRARCVQAAGKTGLVRTCRP
jgi:hypothetical protein